jgi:hypothetical protein
MKIERLRAEMDERSTPVVTPCKSAQIAGWQKTGIRLVTGWQPPADMITSAAVSRTQTFDPLLGAPPA